MSLHVLHKDVGSDIVSGERHQFWLAWCDCGWRGERRWLHESSEAANLARRDYAVHIGETLGAEGFYPADVACKNCGSRHQQGVLIGTPVYSSPCSRCGQTMVMPDNDVWHEETERTKGWRL